MVHWDWHCGRFSSADAWLHSRIAFATRPGKICNCHAADSIGSAERDRPGSPRLGSIALLRIRGVPMERIQRGEERRRAIDCNSLPISRLPLRLADQPGIPPTAPLLVAGRRSEDPRCPLAVAAEHPCNPNLEGPTHSGREEVKFNFSTNKRRLKVTDTEPSDSPCLIFVNKSSESHSSCLARPGYHRRRMATPI